MSASFPIPQLLSVSASHRHAALQVIDCARRGKCCALLGPRLSGTTEVLQAVQAELAQDSLCACIYIDLKEIKVSSQSEFFASLARVTLGRARKYLGEQELGTNIFPIDSGADFRRFLKECALRIKRDLVLIIDHLHNAPNDLILALLTSLRAAYMDQEPGGPVVVAVVCGALSLAALTIGQTSPFANVAEAVFVNVLSDTESAALIQEHTAWASVRLSTGAEAALLRATRGDPRLIERICRSCLQTTGQGAFRQVTARTVNRAVRKFIEEQASSYEPFVEALSLIEDSPDLLRCILLLLEQGTV
ncbi:MAG: hypothetical protein FJY85_05240, partial [Deltaproteobacteria bacterium]|nr:hypothetical protein [Deltaproteobacteria bacterium]